MLEVGVLKTATDTSEVWVGTVRAIVTYTLPPSPDLIVTKTHSPDDRPVIGNSITWTLTVTNIGAGPVTFTDSGGDGQDILEDDLITLPNGSRVGQIRQNLTCDTCAVVRQGLRTAISTPGPRSTAMPTRAR